jgi:pimeloyl-ACP methyl ester carboxylesterase
MVGALVLASGYYYPTTRVDVIGLSAPAIPLLGDIIRYTISPLLGRLMWPMLLRKIFGPANVPDKFNAFPSAMALRPSQIRAGAAESALMIPDAFTAREHYRSLDMPVIIVAGADDRLVNTDEQSAELHREVGHSSFHAIEATGHMVHQTATKRVMAAIDEANQASARQRRDRESPLVRSSQP